MTTAIGTPAKPPPGAAPPAQLAALWPQPVPVLGLTGEKWSGKSSFALTIDPPRTLCYDTEKSSVSYHRSPLNPNGLPFERVDVMAEMLRRFPKGHKPVDRYLWWLEHVRSIPPGKYSVIVADTVNEIEGGLADWVEAHPEHFGHTRAQYLKMSGIKWGDVKDLWLSILATDLASRCETFVFVTHMGDVWGGDNRPTGKRKPKGKDTLYQIASLYLQMERPKDPKGNLLNGGVPAAIVLKDRVARFETDPTTGEIQQIPLLPPRLPRATPHAIRQYMLAPPDMSRLKAEERAPEHVMNEDERAAVRLATAEAERDAEQARLERASRLANVEARRTASPSPDAITPAPGPSAPASSAPGSSNGTHAAAATSITSPPPERKPPATSYSATSIQSEQLEAMAALRAELFASTMPTATDPEKKAKWLAILAKRGVETAHALSREQAAELISKIRSQLDLLAIQQQLHGEQQRGGDSPTGSTGG